MRALGMDFGTLSDAHLERLRASTPTYDHVGSTLEPAGGPHGDRHEDQLTLGTGEAAFAAARSALRCWAPQRALGATIRPPQVLPELDETVVLLLGIGRARLVVPNRIVATIDEPDRYAYAYGTLPGHPERGEELFLIRRHTNDDVVLTIRVDADPSPTLRPVGGIVRALQHAAVRRYLAAVAGHVRSQRDL